MYIFLLLETGMLEVIFVLFVEYVNKRQILLTMSCIKFPRISSDSTKTSNEEETKDCLSSIYCQLVDTANNEFGEGNWSHSITNQTIDFIDYIAGKYYAGCATIVKLQLKNGIFHEGMGYSNLDGASKGSALQKVRLNSLNKALAQVLLCFGHGFSNKVKNSLPISSNCLDRNEEEKEPKLIVQKHPTLSPSEVIRNAKNSEVIDVSISISQTDALMRTVDLDQLFDKSPKPNGALTDKNSIVGKSINIENIKSKVPITCDINKKSDTVASSKKENKEVPKSIVHTAMTEEDMRLERKRKQREMQEEFKRKHEFKKMNVDAGSKLHPNPRY